MNVLIVGAGAVGGFLAVRLSEGGDDVTVLVRAARAEVLRREGLRVVEGGETRTAHPRVVTAPELDGPSELVVLGVKGEALAQAVDDVAPAIGPETAVLPFLNGMDHLDVLRARFGDAVLGGILRAATELRADGAIQLLAPPFEADLGELDGSASARVAAIVDRLEAAGAVVTTPADIVGAMWAKWVFIVSIGALTTLMRAPVGAVADVPEGVALGGAIVAEAAATAAAAGHPVEPGALAANEKLATMPGSPLTVSLYRDLVAQRPTEVEPLLGDFVARAQQLGVATPLIGLATLGMRVHNRRLADAG